MRLGEVVADDEGDDRTRPATRSAACAARPGGRAAAFLWSSGFSLTARPLISGPRGVPRAGSARRGRRSAPPAARPGRGRQARRLAGRRRWRRPGHRRFERRADVGEVGRLVAQHAVRIDRLLDLARRVDLSQRLGLLAHLVDAGLPRHLLELVHEDARHAAGARHPRPSSRMTLGNSLGPMTTTATTAISAISVQPRSNMTLHRLRSKKPYPPATPGGLLSFSSPNPCRSGFRRPPDAAG